LRVVKTAIGNDRGRTNLRIICSRLKEAAKRAGGIERRPVVENAAGRLPGAWAGLLEGLARVIVTILVVMLPLAVIYGVVQYERTYQKILAHLPVWPEPQSELGQALTSGVTLPQTEHRAGDGQLGSGPRPDGPQLNHEWQTWLNEYSLTAIGCTPGRAALIN